MENKEAIELLIKYFKRQSNLEDLYRSLANAMIDYNRILDFSNNLMWISSNDEDEDRKIEYLKFMSRVNLNCDELHKFLKNGDDGTDFSYGQYDGV